MAPISAIDDNKRYTCQAYTIQVERKDFHAMIHLLTKAFQPDLRGEFKFVAFALGKIFTSTSLKAVHSQCAFETNHCVIAIEVLWPKLCNRPSFACNLKVKFPAVKVVHATPQSNLVLQSMRTDKSLDDTCSKQDFVSLAHDLLKRLDIIYDILLSSTGKSPAPNTMVEVSVVSRFPNSDDSSSGLSSCASYLSSLQASFATYNLTDNDIPSEVWETSTASSVHGASQAPATPAGDQYNKTHSEIVQLHAQINIANQCINELVTIIEHGFSVSVPRIDRTLLSCSFVQSMIAESLCQHSSASLPFPSPASK
jgi:hypothetical protein